MKRKLIYSICLVCSLLLLSGCSTAEPVEEVIVKPEYPVGAIFPVMNNEKNNTKSRKIELTDYTLTLPEGYVYGKTEHETYTSYYVWREKDDKEYSLAVDEDIMLYIYDGVDGNSPHKEITDSEARNSFINTYFAYLRDTVSGSFNADPLVTYSDDDSYYVCCFDGYSGEYISTTYAAMCYPKTYYGMYMLQKTTATSDRHFYGFVFSNDNEGEIFKESEYTYLLNEIKTQFNISNFYSLGANLIIPDPEKDTSAGRSYNQMLELFENTYLYYVKTIGKTYERENVDAELLEMEENITPTPADFLGTDDKDEEGIKND